MTILLTEHLLAHRPAVLHVQGDVRMPGMKLHMSSRDLAVIAICALTLPMLFVKAEHLSAFAFLGTLPCSQNCGWDFMFFLVFGWHSSQRSCGFHAGIFGTSMLFVASIAAPLMDGMPAQRNATCVDVGAVRPPGVDDRMGYKLADPAGFGACAGIIMGCVAAHSAFPEMYGARESNLVLRTLGCFLQHMSVVC